MAEKWIVGFIQHDSDEVFWLTRFDEYWIVTPEQDDAAEFPSLKELHQAVEEYVPQNQILKFSSYYAVKLR